MVRVLENKKKSWENIFSSSEGLKTPTSFLQTYSDHILTTILYPALQCAQNFHFSGHMLVVANLGASICSPISK